MKAMFTIWCVCVQRCSVASHLQIIAWLSQTTNTAQCRIRGNNLDRQNARIIAYEEGLCRQEVANHLNSDATSKTKLDQNTTIESDTPYRSCYNTYTRLSDTTKIPYQWMSSLHGNRIEKSQPVVVIKTTTIIAHRRWIETESVVIPYT